MTLGIKIYFTLVPRVDQFLLLKLRFRVPLHAATMILSVHRFYGPLVWLLCYWITNRQSLFISIGPAPSTMYMITFDAL